MSKFQDQYYPDTYENGGSYSESEEGNEEFLQYNETIHENEDENEYVSDSGSDSGSYEKTEDEMPGDNEKSSKMKEQYPQELSGNIETNRKNNSDFQGDQESKNEKDNKTNITSRYNDDSKQSLQKFKEGDDNKSISEEIASENEIRELEKLENKKPENPAFSISSQENQSLSRKETENIQRQATPSKNMEISEIESQKSIKNQNSQKIEKPKMVSTSAGNNPEPPKQPQRSPHEQYLSSLDMKQLGRYNFLIEKNLGIRSELIKVASQLDMLVQSEKGEKLNALYENSQQDDRLIELQSQLNDQRNLIRKVTNDLKNRRQELRQIHNYHFYDEQENRLNFLKQQFDKLNDEKLVLERVLVTQESALEQTEEDDDFKARVKFLFLFVNFEDSRVQDETRDTKRREQARERGF